MLVLSDLRVRGLVLLPVASRLIAALARLPIGLWRGVALERQRRWDCECAHRSRCAQRNWPLALDRGRRSALRDAHAGLPSRPGSSSVSRSRRSSVLRTERHRRSTRSHSVLGSPGWIGKLGSSRRRRALATAARAAKVLQRQIDTQAATSSATPTAEPRSPVLDAGAMRAEAARRLVRQLQDKKAVYGHETVSNSQSATPAT